MNFIWKYLIAIIQQHKNKLQPFSRSTSVVEKNFVSHSAVRLLPFKNFPRPFSLSTSSVEKLSSAVQPYNLIRSKIFLSRSTSSIQKFSPTVQPFDLIHSKTFLCRSTIRPHLFKNFRQPFSRSTSSVHFKDFPLPFSRSTSSVHKFLSAVKPFDVSVLNPFLIRSFAVRSAVGTDTVRNVFV